MKGQSTVMYAFGLAVLAFFAYLAWIAFWSFFGPSIAEEMAKTAGQLEAATTWNQTTTNSHAVLHGQDAIDGQKCLDSHGAAQTWLNGRRKAEVCYEGQKYYIKIWDKVTGEVTIFRREAAKSLGDIGNYLKASGYTR